MYIYSLSFRSNARLFIRLALLAVLSLPYSFTFPLANIDYCEDTIASPLLCNAYAMCDVRIYLFFANYFISFKILHLNGIKTEEEENTSIQQTLAVRG